ncbi:MAG: hypothetical protein MNPFHGCM_00576 [Gemmatimonadaceae bacterium]|nr:hypothetical protein [Gemmatimonadaceae bacterium]
MRRSILAAASVTVALLAGPSVSRTQSVSPNRKAAAAQSVPPRFIAAQPDLFAAGANLTNAWADYDGDGDLDLFVGFNGSPNRLYRNTSGLFADVAPVAGIADSRSTRAAAWGDFDADGDSDLMLGYAPSPGSVLRLYRNDGGRFLDITRDAGLSRDSAAVRQLSWVDVDGDGDLDLFVALRDRPNSLYRNDSGRFTDVAPALGLSDPRRSVGAVWVDYDSDGDLDLYVANQDGDSNGLFRNDGGLFTDVAGELGVAWAGRLPNDKTNGSVRPCAADVDGDGRFDLFGANYGRNGLLLNRGTRFEDASDAWGIAIDAKYDACAFADYDNDGRIDLYVNGTVTGGVSYRDYLFRNTGTRFEDVTPRNLLDLQADHGAEWADYDDDGLVDLALTGAQADGMHLLLRNAPERPVGRSLSVRVVDADGRSTRAGAEIRVYLAGTRTLLAARLTDTGSGYNAQNDAPEHLGIGTADRVDVEVTFPRAGQREATVVRGVRTDGKRTALTVRVPERR